MRIRDECDPLNWAETLRGLNWLMDEYMELQLLIVVTSLTSLIPCRMTKVYCVKSISEQNANWHVPMD